MAQTQFFSTANLYGFLSSASANIFTAVTNELDPNEEGLYINVQSQAAGANFANGVKMAGDNIDIIEVKPPYLPYMVEGAFFAGLVRNLSDADKELTDYQYIKVDNLGVTEYLVWGVCSTTQTDFYTPVLAGATNATIWRTAFTSRS